MNAKDILEKYSQPINQTISKILEDEINLSSNIGKFPNISLKALYQVINKGKGLRGILTLLGYELSGKKINSEVIKAAAAIEIFHAGILVHDDFEDKANMRRGLPTFDIVFSEKAQKLNPYITDYNHLGKALAINLGDYMYFLAYKILSNLKFDQATLIKNLNNFSNISTRLTHGQALDIINSQNIEASEKEISNVIWLKTGEYTSLLPLTTGLILSQNTHKTTYNAVLEYSKGFGYAFQIQDDYLGIYGDPKITGKPNESDLREGKMTLFVMHLLKLGKYNKFLENTLGNPKAGQKEIDMLKHILDETGVTEKVLRIGKKYVLSGITAINSLKDSNPKIKEKLVELIEYIINRAK